MITVPEPDYISFLVGRRFPQLVGPYPSPLAKRMGWSDGIYDVEELPPVTDEVEQAAEIYRKELREMPQSQLKALYDEELRKQYVERDARRFFSQEKANADFEHWARMPYWERDEAVAISFGKDPSEVFLGRMQSILSYTSPFITAYKKLHDVIDRAIKSGELAEPISPSDYIKWAERNGISLADSLKEMVVKMKGESVDWKALYEELAWKTKTSMADMEAEISRLNEELQTVQGEVVSSKERTSFYNIIGALLGMLLGKSSSGVPYSQFNSQQAIIDAIHANYGKISGLSKRSMEAKFADAKRVLAESEADE